MSNDLTRGELLEAVAREAQDDLPEQVKECEKSVREDDPSLSKSQAIAICRDQLDMADAGGCPEGEIHVNGRCVPTEDVDIVPPTNLSLPTPVHLERFDPERIERVQEDDTTVRYTNIKLLGPGRWTDSESRQKVWYSPEGIKNLEIDPENSVHILHDSENEASDAGYIDHESVRHADNGVFADLVFDTSKSAGEFADENMQAALESGGTKGFGGPSVEIPPDGQRVEFNHAEGMPELKGGRISDLGLVSRPGSKDVHFARQTANAAVALSDAQSVMEPDAEWADMSDETLGADALLEALDLELEEDRELADVPIQELVALIAESEDADPTEMMSALEPFIDGEGEEAEMQEDEDEGEEEEQDEGEENDEEGEGDDVDINMEEQVSALEERLAALEDQMDSLMATDEQLSELADAKDALADRVKELEEAPKPGKALAGEASNGEETTVEGPISEIAPSTRY